MKFSNIRQQCPAGTSARHFWIQTLERESDDPALISMAKQKIAAIGATNCPGLIRPSDGATIAAHRVTLPQRNDIQVLRQVSEWRDKQRILGTIELAQETGLTVVLSGDHRDSVRLVEHIGRADIHADVAGRATLGIDDLDQSAASAWTAAVCGRTEVQTSSSPPVVM
jgi:hypothetical protein